MAADGIHEMLVTDDSIVMMCLSGVLDGEQLPFVGDALQLVQPAVGEADPRAEHQHLHRAGDQHLAGPGQGRHAGADVDGQAGWP